MHFLFSAVPALLVSALQAYVEWMCKNAGALSNLRHLLLSNESQAADGACMGDGRQM